MPTNLYGPNDNFDLLSDHVLTALLAKIDAAVRDGRDTVVIWDDERGLASRLGGSDIMISYRKAYHGSVGGSEPRR
jgi:hypothetical protein